MSGEEGPRRSRESEQSRIAVRGRQLYRRSLRNPRGGRGGRKSIAVSFAVMQIVVNGTPRIFTRPVLTVADVIRELALEGKRIAVEMNGEIVPRSRYADTSVDATDRLEIVGAVGGG